MRQPLAADDVGGFANAAVPIAGGVNPVAADLVVFFETTEVRKAIFRQYFYSCKAGAACTNDSDPGRICHGFQGHGLWL